MASVALFRILISLCMFLDLFVLWFDWPISSLCASTHSCRDAFVGHLFYWKKNVCSICWLVAYFCFLYMSWSWIFFDELNKLTSVNVSSFKAEFEDEIISALKVSLQVIIGNCFTFCHVKLFRDSLWWSKYDSLHVEISLVLHARS